MDRSLLRQFLWPVVLVAACGGDARYELFVDLKTDLLPGHEFVAAEIFLEGEELDGTDTGESAVLEGEPTLDGLRIAEFDGLKRGSYRLRVRLRDHTGALVAERPAAFDVRSNRLVTIVITRDCRGVTCDDPARAACLQGRCVAETCTPEDPDSCPDPFCDGTCSPPASACAEAVCEVGACFSRAVEPAVCGPGTYCDPETGCLPVATDGGIRDSGPSDAGPLDAGPPDAGSFAPPNGDLRRESLQQGADPRVVFRYRSYVGAQPLWVSDGTSSLVHALGGSVSAIDRGGDGFDDFLMTRFDGVGDRFLGTSAIRGQAVGYTVQAWFRAESTDGRRTLFSNLDAVGGFSLRIVDGKLQSLVRVRDGAGTRVYMLTDSAVLDPTMWHSAAMQVSVVGTDVRVRLYRDGRWAAEQTGAVIDGLADGTALPAVGGIPTLVGTDAFHGFVHAVEVRNWPVDHDILATPVMRDGSAYFGRPSYHDDVVDSVFAPPELYPKMEASDREAPDVGAVHVRFQAPLANDNHIPQGLTLTPDGRRLFLSLYWTDTSNNNPADAPSTIVEFDMERQRLTRIYRLLDSVGVPVTLKIEGLGFFQDQLYVPAVNRVIRLRLADAVEMVPAVPGLMPSIAELRATDEFATASTGFFLSIDGGSRDLYVGDFSHAIDAPLYRYALTPDGAVARPSTTEFDDRWNVPVADLQGAVWTGSDFLLSTSFADNPSFIWRWTPGGAITQVFELPAGLENLDMGPDGTLWSWSLSGGRYYQKRAGGAWRTLAPWVIGLEIP